MSSGNLRNSSEVTVTFSEISVMTRWKSYAFDSEKVGRYINFHTDIHVTLRILVTEKKTHWFHAI